VVSGQGIFEGLGAGLRHVARGFFVAPHESWVFLGKWWTFVWGVFATRNVKP